ncbi:MAG: BrnT family toxin [Pseudolabrys sp.]|nr:BrnT family toxin [Pseudolabrys sp.]
MFDQQFEWDPAKAGANETLHGVSFKTARDVFGDPFALEWHDNSENYGEDRYVIIGMVDERLLHVAYTMRGDVIRLISARGAEPNERRHDHEANA